MKSTSRRTNTAIMLFCFIASILFLVLITPTNLSPVYRNNWICDSVCFELSFFTLIFLYNKGKTDIFSPIVFVSAIYILMFFITPMYDIYVGETSVFGVTDLFNYGVKGSLVAFLGFWSFILFYLLKYQPINFTEKDEFAYELPVSLKQNIEHLVLFAWTVDLCLGIFIVAITQGSSISYILSFGLIGNSTAFETTTTTLGFIGQFTRSIVTLYLIYFSVSNNKIGKIVLFILTAGLETINGFRYMIVILVFSLFLFHHMKEKKKISGLTLVGIVALLAIVVGVVGYTRNSVRTGFGIQMSGFTIQSILDAVLGNFRIYKSYYSVIKAVPAMTNYIYFDQILIYTLVMAIPRAIWPGKPLNPGTEAQLYGMNAIAVASGFAYPCLGEYYYGFGTIGVIVFMGMLGAWQAKNSNKYRRNAVTELDFVIYCISVPLMLQLLIRGYTPSNFYLILSLFIPYWIFNSYIRKRLAV